MKLVPFMTMISYYDKCGEKTRNIKKARVYVCILTCIFHTIGIINNDNNRHNAAGGVIYKFFRTGFSVDVQLLIVERKYTSTRAITYMHYFYESKI